MEYGNFYVCGIYAGSSERKPKEVNGKLKSDGYNMAITDGKGKFWRVKVDDDPARLLQFGETANLCITNINSFNNQIYYSGYVVAEVPC